MLGLSTPHDKAVESKFQQWLAFNWFWGDDSLPVLLYHRVYNLPFWSYRLHAWTSDSLHETSQQLNTTGSLLVHSDIRKIQCWAHHWARTLSFFWRELNPFIKSAFYMLLYKLFRSCFFCNWTWTHPFFRWFLPPASLHFIGRLGFHQRYSMLNCCRIVLHSSEVGSTVPVRRDSSMPEEMTFQFALKKGFG